MIDTIGIRHRNYTHYTLYGSCLPFYGSLVRSLSFDDAEGNENISVAIKSGTTAINSEFG